MGRHLAIWPATDADLAYLTELQPHLTLRQRFETYDGNEKWWQGARFYATWH